MVRAFLSLCLAVVATVAAGNESVQVFHISRRPVSEAVGVIAPMLSSAGSISIHPTQKTIEVHDDAAVLARVASVLEAWDRPPNRYRVQIRLLDASRIPPTPLPNQGPALSERAAAAIAATPKPYGPHFATIDAALLELFQFRFITPIDTVAVAVSSGSAARLVTAGSFVISFNLTDDPRQKDRLSLTQVTVAKEVRDARGTAPRPLLLTNVNLQLGQTSVIGAARSEDADRAIVLVIDAQREPDE